MVDDQSTISSEKKEGIKFNEHETRGRPQSRAKSPIRRTNSRLPTVYKTVSQNISERINSNVEMDKDFDNESIMNLTWHRDEIESLAFSLESSLDEGLLTTVAASKLAQYGPNKQAKVRVNWFKKIMGYLFGGFGLVFVIGGVLFCLCWKPLGDPPAIANLILGLSMIGIFFIQAVLNWFQDFSSTKVLESVKNILEPECKCIRDGVTFIINTEELVPGDIVILEANTRVPADIRIFELNNLLFDKSVLNGESKPVKATVISNDDNILESTSMAMQGTICIGGHGRGIVVATGSNTIFGKIAKLSSKQKEGFTTIQLELFRFMSIIFGIALTLVVIILIVWGAYVKKHYPEWLTPPNLVGAIVSCFFTIIPEGVPVSFATVLIVTAKRMNKANVVCKSLLTIETLGSVSVLCSDKTGTLTTGVMSVTKTFGNIQKLALYCGLCNESKLEMGKIVNGNNTDKALLKYSMASVDESLFQKYKLVNEIPFDSKFKYLVKIFEIEGNEEYLAVLKGAPDYLFDKVLNFMSESGEIVDIKDGVDQQLATLQTEWAAEGERVLIVGFKWISKTEVDFGVVDNFTAIGLVGLSDPLRDRIPEVLQQVKIAGIKTVMITGDFSLTAISIARKAGIVTALDLDDINKLSTGQAAVISGPEMHRLSEIDWDKLVTYEEIVFSRTSPEQKLKIVKEFQKRKLIVAMTGDGVNDAPSLKQADVGISMDDGTEMAKEASDLILLDSFTSIIDGIKYGRLVFENLRKTICYLLPAGSYSEIWPLLLFAIFGFPQMLSSFLMIIICAVTDCIASMIISWEAEESNLLQKPPRSVSGERLVDLKLLFHAYATTGTYYCFTSMLLAFLNLTRNGYTFGELHKFSISDDLALLVNRSSSIYFVHLVTLQAFNLITVRSRYLSCIHNFNWRLLVIPPIYASTFFWNYIPAFHSALGTATVPVEYYFISIGMGSLVLITDELRKWYIRTHSKSWLKRIAW